MPTVKLTVNGKAVSADVEDRTLLVHLLRDHLGLTGTHVGCDTSQCGACTVHIDGRAVKSCTVMVGQADGCNVVTIEGIARGDQLHPMQEAFRDNHGLQCGYCTPGMIMAAIDIVNRHGGGLDEATVRRETAGPIYFLHLAWRRAKWWLAGAVLAWFVVPPFVRFVRWWRAPAAPRLAAE